MIEIKMPQLGQTTDEVKIIRWLVKEGQEVKKGEPLCEVETDKVIMELESFENGTILKINVEPDTIVNSGTVIAVIGKAGEVIEKSKEAEGKVEITEKVLTNEEQTVEKGKSKEQAGEPDKVPTEYGSEIKAISLVKNLAKIKNIDLRLVKGTGPQGLITREDLDNFIKGNASMPPGTKEINLSQSQIAVARNLSKSKSEIPHYYLKSEIFADGVLKWRETHIGYDNTKVSIYSVLIYAVAIVLKQMPWLNGYFKDNKIILRKDVNIGFALAAGDELYVPVIKNADAKNIFEIDKDLKALSSRASIKKFNAGDLSGGTFTISNLGMFGIDEFCAIINPSQAGILAIGKLRKILYIDESERMNIKNVFTVTASFDHRFVNGKSGAEFIGKFKKIIEEEFN